jgi:hypothetical protein
MEIEPACSSGWTSIATLEGVGLAQAPRRPSEAITRILRRTWVRPSELWYPGCEEVAGPAMSSNGCVLKK